MEVPDRGDEGDGCDGAVGADGSGDALATADAVVCVNGSRLTALTDVAVGADVSGDTVWPLLMLLAVSVEAD